MIVAKGTKKSLAAPIKLVHAAFPLCNQARQEPETFRNRFCF
ncbi:hypothetical protein BN844_1222 [Pseudomonas sp. SHC52]|nr:hypothetical protein BN844_1222 [Pseudomonas sp. SHC52]